MHRQSFLIMEDFVKTYLDTNKNLEILDIGSCDVNGSYKSLFQNQKWKYYGLDIVPGKNVDIVSKSAYDFSLDKKFDIVVSGNCLEHVEAPWKWIKEVAKAIKKEGIICIITPLNIGEHRYPVDCWRILPDGYNYLLENEGEFKVIESKIRTSETEYKFFRSYPKLKWIVSILPDFLKSFIMVPPTTDTYVIAKRV